MYNDNIIGIVETHLNGTVDEDRLAYTFIKNNHPKMSKGVVLDYTSKIFLLLKNCSDFFF